MPEKPDSFNLSEVFFTTQSYGEQIDIAHETNSFHSILTSIGTFHKNEKKIHVFSFLYYRTDFLHTFFKCDFKLLSSSVGEKYLSYFWHKNCLIIIELVKYHVQFNQHLKKSPSEFI
jgi:hypothetical protein